MVAKLNAMMTDLNCLLVLQQVALVVAVVFLLLEKVC